MGTGNSTPNIVSTLEKSTDEDVKEVAAGKLCAKVKQFTEHGSYMVAVAKNAGKPLIGMLEKGTDKGKNNAAATLSYLALNAECKKELAGFGAIPALVKLTKDGTPELKGAAAAALANLVSRSPENQAAMASAGAIPLLLAIVKAGLGESQGWAASALGNLALQHKKNQQKVGEAGAIPALVELTKPKAPYQDLKVASPGFDLLALVTCKKRAAATPNSSKNMEMAARALSSLAFDCLENQVKIIEDGGVEALLSLAKEGSPRDEVEAFRAIGIIWGKDPKCNARARILEAGGVRTFLEMVQNASDDSKAQATHMLARLCHEDPSVKGSVVTGGGIQMFVQLGQNGGPQAKLNAVKALKELSTDCPENEKLIEDAGGKALVERFKSGMQFRPLSEEEETRFNEAQAKADELRKKAEEDANRDPNKPLCFK